MTDLIGRAAQEFSSNWSDRLVYGTAGPMSSVGVVTSAFAIAIAGGDA